MSALCLSALESGTPCCQGRAVSNPHPALVTVDAHWCQQATLTVWGDLLCICIPSQPVTDDLNERSLPKCPGIWNTLLPGQGLIDSSPSPFHSWIAMMTATHPGSLG